MEAALGLSQSGRPTIARARALCAAGDLAYYQDDYQIANTVLEEAVKICRTLQAERELATALGLLGILMQLQGDLVTAGPLLEESEKLCRKLDITWELSYLLRKLAGHAAQTGDLKQAANYAQESLMLAQKLGDKSLAAYVLCTLGEIAARLGVEEPTVVALLHRLEREAWITRTNSPHDRRCKMVLLAGGPSG